VARLEHIADQEGIAVQRDVLDFIARAATGSARDAISLLDQLATYGDEVITLARARAVLGLSDVLVVRNLVSALAGHDVGRGLDVINQVIDGGGDARQFAQQVVDYLRSILLLRVGGDAAALDLDAQTLGDVQDLVPRFSTGTLLQAIKLFNQAQLDLRSSDQGQLALELALVEATMVSLPSPPVQKPDAGRALPGGGTVVREMADDGGTEGGSRSVRPPKPAAVELAAGAGDLPSAPPRSGRRSGQEPTAGRGPQTVQGSTQTEPVTLEEVDLHWAEVRHAIREDSRQVEALVNSSVLRGVEDLNRLVLEFASDFLSGKLEKEENKRIVERALSAVLDKPCRVRGVVRGSFSPPTGTRRPHVESPAPPSAAPGATTSMVKESAAGSQDAGSTEGDEQEPNEDLDPEAPFDPVVQDLIDRGGQVTDVQVLSEE
jgi:DNA polymerase-3 subunit gamma/tau